MAKLVIGTDKTVGAPAVVTQVEVQQPYALLSRVKDDSNNDIGCVVGYHTDANNQKYAVVCLRTSAIKSLDSSYVISNATSISVVTDLPAYVTAANYSQPETATVSCDKITSFAISNNLTTPAIDTCRSFSFVINGVTYYGQLPLISYITMIMVYRNQINLMYPNYNILVGNGRQAWSCTQREAGKFYQSESSGNMSGNWGSNNAMVYPILEIPIQ